MITLNLSPTFEPHTSSEVYERLTVSVEGQLLTVCGTQYDLSEIPVDSVVPHEAFDSPYIIGEVVKDIEGVISITLIQPYGEGAGRDVTFPEPIQVSEDGNVELPDPHWPPAPLPEYPENVESENEDVSEER